MLQYTRSCSLSFPISSCLSRLFFSLLPSPLRLKFSPPLSLFPPPLLPFLSFPSPPFLFFSSLPSLLFLLKIRCLDIILARLLIRSTPHPCKWARPCRFATCTPRGTPFAERRTRSCTARNPTRSTFIRPTTSTAPMHRNSLTSICRSHSRP